MKLNLKDIDAVYKKIEKKLDELLRENDSMSAFDMLDIAINRAPSFPAVPLDKLCEFLADTLHTPAPCFNNEEICPRMDFGYCRLPDAPDVKECWKKILTKWMEGQDAAD